MEKILIVDIPCPRECWVSMEKLGLVVVDGLKMTEMIFNQKSFWSRFDPARTILVFPGNGASIVRGYVPKNWLTQWQWATVHAKRYWRPGEDPWVEANRIFANKMVLGFKDAVVFDDVVSSGKTARLLREKNTPWLPGASWHLVTWVAQRSAALKGFQSHFAAITVGSEDGKKVPINSLSTLVDDQKIAESYIIRNFTDKGQVILKKILLDLRRK